MPSIAQRIKAVDWDRVTAELNTAGWSMLKGLLQPEECDSIAALRQNPAASMPRRPSGYWGIRRKPAPASTRP
jgi:hypothetical protein